MLNNSKEKVCASCGKVLEGRSDKKFCDPYCKSAFHYKRSIEQSPRFYNKVDNQLKTNRRILKQYNKAGKSTVRSSVLIEAGFDPNFFTHYWKNYKGELYLFVYEFGFLKKTEHQTEKYVLIKWQEYMAK